MNKIKYNQGIHSLNSIRRTTQKTIKVIKVGRNYFTCFSKIIFEDR